MGAEQRRFPRIPHGETARLELPVKLSEPGADTMVVSVVVRTVSCQGVGIDLERSDAAHLVPGAEVSLAMQVGDRELALPGRVVWAAGTHAGIRLRLGRSDEAVRRAYAAWIVPITNAEIARLRG